MERSERITAEVKTHKIKDPRRVEQGKRLAAISREAKAKKAREREEKAKTIENSDVGIVPLVVVAVAVGGLTYGAYRYLYTINEEPELEEQQPKKKVPKLSTLD